MHALQKIEFYVQLPNVHSIAVPCSWFQDVEFASGFIRWTCWNSVSHQQPATILDKDNQFLIQTEKGQAMKLFREQGIADSQGFEKSAGLTLRQHCLPASTFQAALLGFSASFRSLAIVLG